MAMHRSVDLAIGKFESGELTGIVVSGVARSDLM